MKQRTAIYLYNNLCTNARNGLTPFGAAMLALGGSLTLSAGNAEPTKIARGDAARALRSWANTIENLPVK
jgi:hypothetical protein